MANDNGGTEMLSLQEDRRQSTDSQECLRKHTEQQQEVFTADRDKDAAYRKLYAIVTIMTMLLFGLNIAQVCLLPVIDSLYWIVLFPGIVFVAYTAWAWYYVASNRSVFFGHVGSAAEGWKRTLQHLGALFFVRHRSERSYQYRGNEPSWPRRFERAGIFLTIYLNIILCQFIYLPAFAVPAFKEITWKMELNASQNVFTPSFALLQNTELSRRATLGDDEASIQQMCDQKMSDPVFENQYCFQNLQNFTYGNESQHHVRYVTFDGSLFPNISMGMVLGLWYQYFYNSTASRDPLLSIAAFDGKLLPIFPKAVACGIITLTPFPAGDRNQASLHQMMINDKYNAMDRPKGCKGQQAFKHYNKYEIDIVPLGEQTASGHNNCDIGKNPDKPLNGSCNADVTVSFPSTLSTVYTSEHGKDWITILTEEGGIVGFVTFLTWFFGIFRV